MRDLLRMARDIACGCRYLEENHFIHRFGFAPSFRSLELIKVQTQSGFSATAKGNVLAELRCGEICIKMIH